jgi:hypothetical protein
MYTMLLRYGIEVAGCSLLKEKFARNFIEFYTYQIQTVTAL